MSNIKVIEGLEPWEVMKRASEGEEWAVRWKSPWVTQLQTNEDLAYYISQGWEVAIIDTTTSEIDWDKVDWDFFSPDRPLTVTTRHGGTGCILCRPDSDDMFELRESPFYYWAGGEQPVPDNVEVEVVTASNEKAVQSACDTNWSHGHHRGSDIIAFKLTGRVL